MEETEGGDSVVYSSNSSRSTSSAETFSPPDLITVDVNDRTSDYFQTNT